MEQLSPEILLSIFKKLDSKEMVKVTRVCKSWFQIIEANKTLWRRLVLPDKHRGWRSSIAEMFGEKSGNTLEEIEMRLDLSYDGYSKLAETIERSKETLKALRLLDVWQGRARAVWTKRLWDFPHLVECRITLSSPRVRLLRRGIEDGDQDSRNHLSKLKVLWIDYYFDGLFAPRLQLLDNLSSLNIEHSIYSTQCRKILETPSRTLKHLDISLIDSDHSLDLPLLNFPRMQVLEVLAERFPCWMRMPYSSTVIADLTADSFDSFDSLPSVSTIWIEDMSITAMAGLSRRCPHLINLRIKRTFDLYGKKGAHEKLLKMLKDRRENAAMRMEVDGIAMAAVKTLVIPLREFNTNQINEIQALVEKVIDVDATPEEIELEI